jgi:GNAT superfamily N-acetyltransferase
MAVGTLSPAAARRGMRPGSCRYRPARPGSPPGPAGRGRRPPQPDRPARVPPQATGVPGCCTAYTSSEPAPSAVTSTPRPLGRRRRRADPALQSIPCRALLTEVNSKGPRSLTRAFHREQAATYGFADDPADTPPGEFDPPQGTFLVASAVGGAAIACWGWRSAGSDTAEFKRLYVTPPARGQGLARHLMAALEQDARRHGKNHLILETGVRSHAALALFTACGFTSMKSYVQGRDPAINRAMQKTLPNQRPGHEAGRTPRLAWLGASAGAERACRGSRVRGGVGARVRPTVRGRMR